MDIGMNTANGGFSLRAAALIIHDDQLLVIKHDDFDCFYTIGGGVNVNETSVDAVIREVREETGYLLSVDRLAYIQERFYKSSNTHHHEVVFFYLMKSADEFLFDEQPQPPLTQRARFYTQSPGLVSRARQSSL